MQVLPAKRREENCTDTERYLRGLKNQNEDHVVIYVNQASLKHKSYSLAYYISFISC